MRTEESQKFINDVFSTARFRGICQTKSEFASLLGVNRSGLSTAMNGNPKHLTRSLVSKVQDFAYEQGLLGKPIPTPAEKQDYSDLNDLERTILRGFLCAGVENVPVSIIKDTAKECIAQMKPADRNDTDMKEAVEGEVVKNINNKLAVTAKNINLDGFRFGDKVKIIIVKKEEK